MLVNDDKLKSRIRVFSIVVNVTSSTNHLWTTRNITCEVTASLKVIVELGSYPQIKTNHKLEMR